MGVGTELAASWLRTGTGTHVRDVGATAIWPLNPVNCVASGRQTASGIGVLGWVVVLSATGVLGRVAVSSATGVLGLVVVPVVLS
jgi:hypothetical protein